MRSRHKPSASYNRLRREAKRRDAEIVVWNQDHNGIYIEVRAPEGSVWKVGNENILTYEAEKSDSAYCDEAVEEILLAMSQGFSIVSETHEHDRSCECSDCEAFDAEVEELHFALG